MVRRTKEESLETRRAIIDAAREVFYTNGVTRTSLEQIAAAAGVTRGAIYWHFADKAELFYAMRDEVKIPMMDRSDAILDATDSGLDALQKIEHFLRGVIDHIEGDPVTKKTFEILTFKCEYVGEFGRDLDMACTQHAELHARLEKVYREAQREGILRAGLTPAIAAADTMVFMSGLFKIWIVDSNGSLVHPFAARLIADHADTKRAVPPAPKTARKAVSRSARK